MSWLDRNLHWVLLAALVATTVALVGLFPLGVLVVVAGALSGASVATSVGSLALVLVLTAALVALDAVLAVGLVVTLLRRITMPSLPRSDRAAKWFWRFELIFPPLRALDLSGRFEPTLEDRTERLKDRYVDGELTELEFERQMNALLDDGEADSGTVASIQAELDRIGEAPARSHSVAIGEAEGE